MALEQQGLVLAAASQVSAVMLKASTPGLREAPRGQQQQQQQRQ
jgi:hypothetical protein